MQNPSLREENPRAKQISEQGKEAHEEVRGRGRAELKQRLVLPLAELWPDLQAENGGGYGPEDDNPDFFEDGVSRGVQPVHALDRPLHHRRTAVRIKHPCTGTTAHLSHPDASSTSVHGYGGGESIPEMADKKVDKTALRWFPWRG